MVRMLTSILIILILLSQFSFTQNIVQGQKELKSFIINGKAASLRNAINVELTYKDVNSELALEHTRELRAAQIGMEQQAGDEEIVFCLDNGINVQNVDGSGRRLIIATGPEHQYFSYPAWSLDGKRIAFAAQRTDPRVVDLAVANADGSNAVVILTLNTGYLKSFISSISWSWDSNYIMFTYYYDDYLGYEAWVVCTIRWTGADLNIGANANRTFCQYEPFENSTRYAYIENVYPNTNFYVSNLDGTNQLLWAEYVGVISGFTHIAWNHSNSIYTVVRYHPQYQNQELFIRLDRVGGNTSNTILFISDINASLWSPTVSPDRQSLYNSEGFENQDPKLWLTTLEPTVSSQYRGVGHWPNWRQKIPELQLPEKVILQFPQSNSVSDGREDGSGIWINLGWNPVANAETYTVSVVDPNRMSVHFIENISETSIELLFEPGKRNIWKVMAVNSDGSGPYSDQWNFTTLLTDVEDYDYSKKEYALYQNYPNPFNPTTTINYSTPKQGHVAIKVFDALGIELLTLVNKVQPQGNYEVDFDASNFTSGIYFYRIQTDEFVITKKMVLTK